jgi:hypothetical protein
MSAGVRLQGDSVRGRTPSPQHKQTNKQAPLRWRKSEPSSRTDWVLQVGGHGGPGLQCGGSAGHGDVAGGEEDLGFGGGREVRVGDSYWRGILEQLSI